MASFSGLFCVLCGVDLEDDKGIWRCQICKLEVGVLK